MRKFDLGQFEKPAEMFGFLWTAFRATYPRKAAGFEQMKLCNRLGDKLEAISKAQPVLPGAACGKCGRPTEPGDEGWRVPTKHTLLLEAMEHEKLVSMLKDEQIGWLHAAGHAVERLVVALEAAPTVDVEERAGASAARKKVPRA